jgi:TolB-like protein
MKIKAIIILFIVFGIVEVNAQTVKQTSFDTGLQELTDMLSRKLTSYITLKMAVWDLSNLNGSVSPIGQYISEDVSINLSDKFHIVNRNQLNTLLKENRLSGEGFINPATLRQVKKLSDVDVIITGTISILSDRIRITLQALDVNANILGAVKGEVPMNPDVRELLGINVGSTNRGFNRSLNSNEDTNNPQSVNKDCETKNTGDYCFSNNSKFTLKITIFISRWGAPLDVFVLSTGESKCIYNYQAGNVYKFQAQLNNPKDYNNGYRAGNYWSSDQFFLDIVDEGSIRIDRCESKTYTVRSNNVRNP